MSHGDVTFFTASRTAPSGIVTLIVSFDASAAVFLSPSRAKYFSKSSMRFA